MKRFRLRDAWMFGAAAMGASVASAPASAQAASGDVEIQAPGPEGPLGGAYRDAGKGTPVVLMIPGSGPTNRDGDSPGGLRTANLKLLADGLAADGISSVRIDKRGMFSSKAAVADANAATTGLYAQDVHSWIKTIRERTGAPCVWVFGHSEGGLVALKAAQTPEGICGLILVSAAGRPIGTLMREQFRSNPQMAPFLDDALVLLDAFEAGKTVPVAEMNPVLAGSFAPAIQPYLIDLLSHDPAKYAAAYDGPVLIVQGDQDIQVSVADAQTLKAASPHATLVIVPGATHALKKIKGEGREANIATYLDPSLPLAPEIVPAIAAFVKGGANHH